VGHHLEAVRTAHPQARIIVACGTEAAPIVSGLAFYDRLIVSRLFTSRQRTLPILERPARALRAGRLLLSVGRRQELVLCFWPIRRLLRLCMAAIGRRHLSFSDLAAGTDSDLTVRAGMLLRMAGMAPPRIGSHPLRTGPDEEAALAFLSDAGAQAPFVVCHPGSDWACQQWKPERWAELGDRLVQRHLQVVFTGIDEEAPLIARIQAEMRETSCSLAGRTSCLGELEAVLARADLCVCVDSVVHELAVAAGTRAVILVGPTADEAVWSRRLPQPPLLISLTPAPLREVINTCRGTKGQTQWGRWRCLDYDCPMAGLPMIGVADVLAALDDVSTRL
jgi:ADP-heptose:LPS heptosyltransferase